MCLKMAITDLTQKLFQLIHNQNIRSQIHCSLVFGRIKLNIFQNKVGIPFENIIHVFLTSEYFIHKLSSLTLYILYFNYFPTCLFSL